VNKVQVNFGILGPLEVRRGTDVVPVAGGNQRKVLLALALRRLPYREVFAAEPRWARWSGIAQMLLFTAALAPFGGPLTRLAVRLAAPAVSPA